MRKVLVWLLAAACLCAAALADAGEATFALRFDEGFTLSLPEGWVSYPAGQGPVRYVLGPGDGARFLYILAQKTDIDGFDALREAIEANGACGKASPLDLNGREFAAFLVPDLNASGCSTVLDGELVTLLFTPQGDSDFMLEAARIMASFKA